MEPDELRPRRGASRQVMHGHAHHHSWNRPSTLGTGHHSPDGLKAKAKCASSPVNIAVDAGGSFIAYVGAEAGCWSHRRGAARSVDGGQHAGRDRRRCASLLTTRVNLRRRHPTQRETSMTISRQSVTKLFVVTAAALLGIAIARADVPGELLLDKDMAYCVHPTGKTVKAKIPDGAAKSITAGAHPVTNPSIILFYEGQLYIVPDKQLENGRMASEMGSSVPPTRN